jgi:hypothetical protein
MKTKTLLMIAGAGALALLYWKWYKPKRTERKKALASNRYECEELAGGRWIDGSPAPPSSTYAAPAVMVGSCV